jgi:hypothetical protein
MFFKKLVISEGGVPILIKLLHHPVPEVRQQVRVPLLLRAQNETAGRQQAILP